MAKALGKTIHSVAGTISGKCHMQEHQSSDTGVFREHLSRQLFTSVDSVIYQMCTRCLLCPQQCPSPGRKKRKKGRGKGGVREHCVSLPKEGRISKTAYTIPVSLQVQLGNLPNWRGRSSLKLVVSRDSRALWEFPVSLEALYGVSSPRIITLSHQNWYATTVLFSKLLSVGKPRASRQVR